MHVPEEGAGRSRRVGRNAQATNAAKSTPKSTMVNLRAPATVGLHKPPQISAKVRELVGVCLHWSSYPCLQEDRLEHAHSCTLHVLLVYSDYPLIDVMVFCKWPWDGPGGKWYEGTDTK